MIFAALALVSILTWAVVMQMRAPKRREVRVRVDDRRQRR